MTVWDWKATYPDQKIPKRTAGVEVRIESSVAEDDEAGDQTRWWLKATLVMGRSEHMAFWTTDAGESYVKSMYYLWLASS